MTHPVIDRRRDCIAPSGSPFGQGPSVNQCIRALAADGLKVRDISSVLHVHPIIVIRELERENHSAK